MAIFALAFLQEVITLRRGLVLSVGFIGVLVIAQPLTAGGGWYALLALLSAAAVGMISVVISKLSQSERLLTVLTYQAFGVGAVLLIPGTLVWKAPTLIEWILLILAGLMSALGQSLTFAGFRVGQATVVTAAEYLQLVFAAVLAYFAFGELPQRSTLTGGAIVIFAAWYALHYEHVSRKTGGTPL